MYDFDALQRGYGINRRRVSSDGLVEIMCRICEKPICKEQYRGFSTAICAVCQGELDAGKRPEDIIRQTLQKEQLEHGEVLNDLGMGGFRAHGIGQRIKEVIKEVRQRAFTRKRSPLFSVKDKPDGQ